MENLSDLDAVETLGLAVGIPLFLAFAGYQIAQHKGNAKWEARFQKLGVTTICLVFGAIALVVIAAQ